MQDMLPQLLENIHRYQFQQALYLIENTWLADHKIHENHPQLKLLAANQVSFPGADISHAIINKQQQIELSLNFMGLYGVDAPLPHYFIDLCLRDEESAECLRHFLNVVSRHLWCLLYRGWKKYHPYVEVQHAHSRYLHYLQALSGGVLNAQDTQEYALTGLLGSKFNGASGLVSCVQNLLNNTQVILKQFQSHWQHRLNVEQLGRDHLVLGDNIALGHKLLSVQQRISLEIGPVSLKFAMTLWPNQVRAKRLNNLIRRYLPPQIKHNLVVNVRPETKRQLQLGATDNFLGWSTWLGTPLKQSYALQIANNI